MPPGGDVSLGELARKLDDMRSDMREMRNGYVPRGEWEEHRKANGERIGNVERAIAKVETALATINRTAWTGVVLPIIVTILITIIIASAGLK